MIDVYDIQGDKKLAIKYTADRAILIGLQVATRQGKVQVRLRNGSIRIDLRLGRLEQIWEADMFVNAQSIRCRLSSRHVEESRSATTLKTLHW